MTLQGDTFDLAGTLEGGAPQSRVSVLEGVSELAAVSASLADKRAQLAAAEAELAAMSKVCVGVCTCVDVCGGGLRVSVCLWGWGGGVWVTQADLFGRVGGCVCVPHPLLCFLTS